MKSTSTFLARAIFAASLLFITNLASAEENKKERCRWWEIGCQECRVEGFPSEAPHEGTVITIDISTNQAYLFHDGELVKKSAAATGTDKVLKRGRHKVLRKIEDPVWTKPDWAFIEEAKPVPPPDSPRRKVAGKLGKYALDLGDGILIHGTDDPKSIGRRASHGCIRLPNEMLKTVYKAADVGTVVYIFDSETGRQQTTEKHSDLDYLKD